MKSATFEYSRPSSVEEACRLLAHDEDARIIAGGQTLVPMMAMRLARPTRLIDISRIGAIDFIKNEGDAIAIGAATRQRVAEHDRTVASKLPLLARALPWVGHMATRTRGTIGGSLANADPAAEIPLVLATLGGELIVHALTGETRIAAANFFEGPMTTALARDAVLTQARFPIWPERRIGAAFLEISARRGDFAYVAAAAQVALDESGRCLRCAIGLGGATPVPTPLATASAALVGAEISEALAFEAIEAELGGLDIMVDPYATPAYRRRAGRTLACRALLAARDMAQEGA